MRLIWKILIGVLIFALGLTVGLLGPWGCCGSDCVCDILRGTYKVNGVEAVLSGGKAVTPSQDGGPATLTRIERLPLSGDLDDDGNADTAVVLSQARGGTLTYYVTAIPYNTGKAFEALPLGEGARLLDYDVSDNCIWVTVLARKAGQPKDSEPTVEKLRQFTIRDGKLIEV